MRQPEFISAQGQMCNGLQLYWYCQSLALHAKQQFQGNQLLPSGARIFYYTRRLLVAEQILPGVNPDEAFLPALVVEHFLQKAPLVTEHLSVEFARAVQLRAEPGPQLKQLLSSVSPLCVPMLSRLAEHLIRNEEECWQDWERLWKAKWKEAEQEHLARLWVWIHPDRLLVVPVAGSRGSPQAGLRLLHAQLSQDAKREWRIPPGETYLYHEPLEEWLLRPLLTGRWFHQLCREMAELVAKKY